MRAIESAHWPHDNIHLRDLALAVRGLGNILCTRVSLASKVAPIRTLMSSSDESMIS